ncbi:hypothetical protein C2857_003893 [Epichloe festucae Fl1]|uniref:Uncharacterized protein n=1 Tax=Epichloe festucae (strain Fl1) TaxID=877507 RepID=A0A7S9PTN5_EPIFF|nr:hypothetical protein C2857_003893 [Epichloe festucae Fl1]
MPHWLRNPRPDRPDGACQSTSSTTCHQQLGFDPTTCYPATPPQLSMLNPSTLGSAPDPLLDDSQLRSASLQPYQPYHQPYHQPTLKRLGWKRACPRRCGKRLSTKPGIYELRHPIQTLLAQVLTTKALPTVIHALLILGQVLSFPLEESITFWAPCVSSPCVPVHDVVRPAC